MTERLRQSELLKLADRTLANLPYDLRRLAELANEADLTHDPEIIEEVEVLRIVTRQLLRLLQDLDDEEMQLIYWHYETGLSYRQIANRDDVFYSYRSLHEKTRRILRKIIRALYGNRTHYTQSDN